MVSREVHGIFYLRLSLVPIGTTVAVANNPFNMATYRNTPEDIAVRNRNFLYPGAGNLPAPKLPSHLVGRTYPGMASGGLDDGKATDLMTPPPNRFQFENANTAASNAEFAKNAPPLTAAYYAKTRSMTPGTMSVTLPAGQKPAETIPGDSVGGGNSADTTTVARQGTMRLQSYEDEAATAMARRGAYVNRQQRLADYLHPGMDSASFARDANTRANTQSAATAGQVGAQTEAIKTNTDRFKQMTPGTVLGQDIANEERKDLIQPKVNQLTAAATAGPEQMKAMQAQLKIQADQNKTLQQQLAQFQKQQAANETRIKFLETQLQRPAKTNPLTGEAMPTEPVYNQKAPAPAAPAVQQSGPVQQNPPNIGAPPQPVYKQNSATAQPNLPPAATQPTVGQPQQTEIKTGTVIELPTGQRQKFNGIGWDNI